MLNVPQTTYSHLFSYYAFLKSNLIPLAILFLFLNLKILYYFLVRKDYNCKLDTSTHTALEILCRICAVHIKAIIDGNCSSISTMQLIFLCFLLQSCTSVAVNFVSPESVGECIRLSTEYRSLPLNHRCKEDKLQVCMLMFVNALNYMLHVLEPTC